VQYFQYPEEAIEYLKSKDAKLAYAINYIGPIMRPLSPGLFPALMNSIVGQQISSKAHATVWKRIVDTMGDITPEKIANADDAYLQSFGLSFRKVGYMKQAAESVLNGAIDLEALNDKTDDEVCTALSTLPGIGVWTAEMLMIFTMNRMNILSYGDFAVRKGMRMLFRHRDMKKPLFEKYRRKFSPYASVASLYFWAISSGAIPELTDPAVKKKK